MKKIIGFFLSLICLNLYSQENIEGHVIDIGLQETVSNALVYALPSKNSTYCDQNGWFSLNTANHQNSIEQSILISGNHISWNSEDYTSYEIYDIKSSLVHKENIQNKQSIYIPNLYKGYYFLIINSQFYQNKYLLFSDGKQLYLRKKSSLNSPAQLSDTSIIIEKDEYFSNKIKLELTNTQDTFFILKKQYDSLTHFTHLLSPDAFEMLSNTPSVTNYGAVEEIKIIHELYNDKIYYINIKKNRSHYTFAKNQLGYEFNATNFLYTQYSNNPSRRYNLATIHYHENIDTYVLQFNSLDQLSCESLEYTYQRILATSFLGQKLKFYCNKSEWESCSNIPKISSDEIYWGQTYQALNQEENYGYLIKTPADQVQNEYLGRRQIVLLDGIPNDIPVVAGIITNEFQTALSHINILSHNRKTPNMALKDAWTNQHINELVDKLVYLKVELDTFIIRQACLEEAEAFWSETEPQEVINLNIDTLTNGIVDLEFENISSTNKIGGKAANFSELVHLDSIVLPEDYFAIPFYYYHQHLKENQIDSFIDEMLGEQKFYSDLFYRKMRLVQLQNIITNAPLNQNFLELVENRLDHFNRYSSYRFRSSTNAEDLENFSGAGLYSSFSAKKDDADKTISKAIKKVWASLWDIRAFEEREYYKINNATVAMGILVHRSFPNEDANGVAITSNLYNVNHAYTVNCQYKDYSIVYPEPGIIHDQVLIHTMSFNDDPYNIEYLSHSNIPELNGNTVLSNEELLILGDYCTQIKKHYFNNIASDISCGYNSFSVDIEFKIDSSINPRKLYIKQARIYKIH